MATPSTMDISTGEPATKSVEWKSKAIQVVSHNSNVECGMLTTSKLQAPSLATLFDHTNVNAASGSRAGGGF